MPVTRRTGFPEQGEQGRHYGFPGVSALGKPDGGRAAVKLAALHAELTRVGAAPAAQRLRDMDGSVRHLPFAVTERLVAADRTLAELDDLYHEPARRRTRLRNQAALAPLFFTWFWLAIATYFYGRQVAASPELVTRPFMLLWEDRFGGQFVLTFAEIALFDALLIALIVGLTWSVHRAESRAVARQDKAVHLVDEAMLLLAVAVERDAGRVPVSAQEWATAAQSVVSGAAKAVVDVAGLINQAERRNEVFVKKLAEETVALLQAVEERNEQFIRQTVERASIVLRDVLEADRALVNNEMAPLVERLRASVEDFNRNAATHQESTTKFVGIVSDLGAAAKVLGESTSSYTALAGAIDGHLRAVESSQAALVAKVKGSADSMVTAAKAMEDVSSLVSGSLRKDFASITSDLGATSGLLVRVNGTLTGTTAALEHASKELRDAASRLSSAGPRPSRRWRFRKAHGAGPDGRHTSPDGRHAGPDGRHTSGEGRHTSPDGRHTSGGGRRKGPV